jgi:hypothetical protein
VLGRRVTAGKLRTWVVRRRVPAAGALIATVALAGAAFGAGPGGWGHLGDAGTPGTDSLNGVADSLNDDATGLLYVGGGFTNAGGIAAADRIAAWNGSAWSAVGSGIDNGLVRAIAYADGKVYAGGTFLNAGGDANADRLAVWDGASWAPFCGSAGPTFTGNVDALQIVGSTLYVGGAFQNWGDNDDADYLVACNLGSGAASMTTVDPFPGPVYALAADPDGVLYAGGHWNDLENNLAADNVAYRDGTGWHEMGAGGGSCGCVINGFVRSLAADAAGVYVGTDVKNVDGIPEADNVVKWDGSDWSALGANGAGDDGWFPASTFIYGMTVNSSVVFATGSFQNANGDALADNVAYFREGAWHRLGSDGAGNGPWIGDGLALARMGGNLFAAGGFTSAGGDTQARSVASYAMSQIVPVPTPTVTPGPSPAPTPTVTPQPAPETTITSGPAEGSTISDSTPTFEFVSSDPGAYFVCTMYPQVDPNGIGVCTSPMTQPELSDRNYEFIVYSQGAPLVETSPEHRTFTVDTIDPKARLSGRLTQTADAAIGVTVSCGAEACKVVASGSVSVPGAARLFRLRTVKRAVAAKHRASLALRVPAKAQRAIRVALRHHRRVAARITVRVADKAGNARIRHRRVKLRR